MASNDYIELEGYIYTSPGHFGVPGVQRNPMHIKETSPSHPREK